MKISWAILISAFLCVSSALAQSPNAPAYLRNELTLQSLNSNTREAVVLIHGWNPDGNADSYAASTEWSNLISQLKTAFTGSDWNLVLYHWETDASTGYISFDEKNPSQHAADAAINAYSNGVSLAYLLANEAPNLRSVHFIAHSAGSWAAYRAAIDLIQYNPYVNIEITLLDPFIPKSVPPPFTPQSPLYNSSMGSLMILPRIFRLENYYADDSTSWDPARAISFTWGTQDTFSWSVVSNINQIVDWGGPLVAPVGLHSFLYFQYYDWHSGPIQFYGDTVQASLGNGVPAGLSGSGCPFVLNQVGWFSSEFKSLGSVFPVITTQPKSQSVTISNNVTLSVTAAGTGPLTYQWIKDGFPINNATNASYSFVANNSYPTEYLVSIQNNNGTVYSDKVTVYAYAPAAPTITSVSPTTFTGLPLPQTQTLHVYGSGFYSSSTLLFNGSVASDSTRLHYVSPYEIDYDIRTDTNAANWNVVVVNGTQKSNLGYFTVNPPTPNTGSLVVNLTPPGAISTGAQWLMNGVYHNSGDVVSTLVPGQYTVSFKSIIGYTTPSSVTATISANQQTTVTGSYSANVASTYTLTVNQSSGSGVINNSPVGSWNGSAYNYSAGSIVQLTAIANPGYHFVSWSGDVSGTTPTINLTMNGNKTVSALFASGDPNMGTIVVNIQPPGAATAGVQWGWNSSDYRNSGTSYSMWPGSYLITLHPVDGWISPTPNNLVPVTLVAGQTTNYTYTFTQDTTPAFLTVTISPPNAAASGAVWHVNGGAAQSSGATVALPPGTNYVVTFDSNTNWTAPNSQTVALQRGQTTALTATYTTSTGLPVIESITPPLGPMAGGTVLTISGANFSAPADVVINGQAASNVVVTSSSQITCVTPVSTNYGSAVISVQAPSGKTTNSNGFAYGFSLGTKLDLVSAIGGSCHAVAVQGSYAFIGEGHNFLTLNIANPNSPIKVAQVTLPGLVRGVALWNQFAYVANSEGGLQVIDISVPSSPRIVGCYSSTNQLWSAGLSILGGRAYVADEIAGLQIFDLSIPTLPALISTTNIGGGEAIQVTTTASGVFAYISTGGSLCVVDVSNPNTPILRGRGTINSPGGAFAYSLAVSGNYVYAADLSYHLEIIDVSNPNAPVDVGSAPNAYSVYSVFAANGLIYAAQYQTASYQNAFYVFSPNGASLTLLGQTTTASSSGYNMFVSGSKAYIAGGASGFETVDVSNPYSPSLVSAFSDAGVFRQYNSAAITGNTLAACGYPEGTLVGFNSIFNAGNPAALTFAASPNSGGSKVIANNGLAYVLGQNSNSIYNVSSPSSPQLLKNFASTAYPGINMCLGGNTLYIVGMSAGNQPHFAAFDVSTPTSPTIKGSKDFTEFSSGIAVAAAVNGNLALIAINSYDSTVPNQVAIVDISNISSPAKIGAYTNLNSFPRGVQISADGKYGFILTAAASLAVINLSQPISPTLVTNIIVDSSSATDIKLNGTELYVTTYRGVYCYDISNPVGPVLSRKYAVLAQAQSVCIPTDSINQAGYIYITANDEGIVVLKEQDTLAPQVYISNPIFGSRWTNTTYSLNMGGAASDNNAVTAMSWVNDRGGSGIISPPFNNWSVNAIPTFSGTNNITITAFDAAGNAGVATLQDICQPPLQAQSISFSAIPDHIYGDVPFLLSATASSGLPVSFSVLSGPAIITNNLMTLTGASAVTVRASQAGSQSFAPASPVDVTFNISKAGQAIAFPPPGNKSAGDPPFKLTAIASSGLPVAYSVVSGPVSIDSNNVVTLQGTGTVIISAAQVGNTNYNAAVPVQVSFGVTAIPQFISFNPLSAQKYGDAPFPIAASSSSGLPVSFSVVSGPIQMSGNIVMLTGWGTATIRASQSGNSFYASAPTIDQQMVISAPDTNSPTLKINTPQSNIRWSNAVITTTGTATDNVQVASIWCRANANPWNYASGTTNWTINIPLDPGTNILQAYAMDISGNRSATNSLLLQYVVTNRLAINMRGVGTISPNYSNAWLEIGRNYAVKATAQSGFMFTNWVASTNWNGGSVTNNANLQFTMSSNLTLLAYIVDVTKPTIVVSSPTANQKMTNALAYLVGTASDNWKLDLVKYQLNSNAWATVNTTNGFKNWSQTVALLLGTNTFRICAQDMDGNLSATNTVKVTSGTTFNLQFLGVDSRLTSTNGLSFSLMVSSNLNGHIEYSTNLINWLTWTNFKATNLSLKFRDFSATNAPRKFYRAVVP